MAKELRKKVKKAIEAKNKEVNPPRSSFTYSTAKEKGPRISTKTADIVAKRTRGKESIGEKIERVVYAEPRKLTATEKKAAKLVQARRNQDLKKTAARGVGILKTQAKKKAASNARKAIGG
jgi:hypothetical protein